MVGRQYNHQQNSPEVRGRHFKILKRYLVVLSTVGIVNIPILIFDIFGISGIEEYKSIVFPLSLPVLLIFLPLMIFKLLHLQKRTDTLVNYVDTILTDVNKFRSLFERSLFERSLTAHVLLHPLQGIVEYNAAFLKLLELDTLTFDKFSVIVDGPQKDEKVECANFHDFIQKAIENDFIIGKWNLKSNKIIPTKIAATRIYLKNEEYVMLSIHDETQYKLKQEQLKKITAKAIDATKAKSEFLANMTHELRTPLNGIIGLSEELIESSDDENVIHDAEVINQSGKSLLGLINNVLDYSKLDAQKVELEKIPVNLYEVTTQIDNTLGYIARKKELDFKVNIDKDIPVSVLSDQTRLVQVLNNLVGNAIKFTEKGSVSLNILNIGQATNEHYSIQFIIQDSGIGMNEEALKNLFTSFHQADSSINRKYGGTGLGLSISKQIVELMNSNIEVESEQGKGSKFFFTIKLKENTKITSVKDKDISNITLTETTLNKNILIAEDNKVNQLVAKKYFARLGFVNVNFADNGKVALDMVLEKNYDFIFMDMQMPIMDGVEATMQIQEKVHFLELPIIIAMTANNSDEDKRKCFEAGMSEFLSKPLNLNELRETIFKFENESDDEAA